MAFGMKERKRERERRVELLKTKEVAFECSCNKCLRCGGIQSKIIRRPKVTPIGDYGRGQRTDIKWVEEVYCPQCGESRQDKHFKHINGLRHRNWCVNKI